ncbi:MAG TPA: RDD family protein [Blastocatellia bacterium]|jgi:Predicted membrane protein/domain
MNSLIGDSSKKRMLAVGIDSSLATVLSLIAAGMVNSFGATAVITALCSAHLAYFFVFEALWSRTPGKYLFGLHVCQVDGSRCTLRSAMLRTLLRVIEVNPILLGALPAGIMLLVTKRKQRLGDLLSGTVVISNKILPETAVNDNK